VRQKLVSFYLSSQVDSHLEKCEHLNDYLANGWRVSQLWTEPGSPPGGRSDESSATAWVLVLLEQA